MCTNLGMGLDTCKAYDRMVEAYLYWQDVLRALPETPANRQRRERIRNRVNGYKLEMQEHIGRSTEMEVMA